MLDAGAASLALLQGCDVFLHVQNGKRNCHSEFIRTYQRTNKCGAKNANLTCPLCHKKSITHTTTGTHHRGTSPSPPTLEESDPLEGGEGEAPLPVTPAAGEEDQRTPPAQGIRVLRKGTDCRPPSAVSTPPTAAPLRIQVGANSKPPLLHLRYGRVRACCPWGQVPTNPAS